MKNASESSSVKLYKSDYIMQGISHVVLGIMTLLALLPFVLLIIASFTDEETAIRNGFSFFPEKWGLKRIGTLRESGHKSGMLI